MSSLKERKEKNCLNCKTEVQGRFCQNCGQENIETKETVWHLVSHFFKDITHFDGKFFSTLKYLVFKPGFVSKEYMIGRRASYVNPVRMYIFTSAFFFLIFFSFMNIGTKSYVANVTIDGKSYEQIMALDSISYDAFIKERYKKSGKTPVIVKKEEFRKYFDSSVQSGISVMSGSKYRSRAEYDSLLKTGKKDNWIQRRATYKQLEIEEKYKNNTNRLFVDYWNMIMHSLPQMFFLLLPLFALILKLLYRRKKDFFYVNHAIFSVHFYIFSFLNMLPIFGIEKLVDLPGWGFMKYLQIILVLLMFFYLYKAMRNFYEQRRGKTILKFILLCLSLLIMIFILFLIFIIFSFFKL